MSEIKEKKILVTGAEGMLGSDLMARLRQEMDVRIFPATIHDLDVADLVAVRDRVLDVMPDIVIHCAAYTAVDQAEEDQHHAYLVNAGGTKNLAIFCREIDAEMYYISTDFVFDGAKGSPYLESDDPSPINTYGATKLAGERFVAALVPRHKICRTSWLCGHQGRNFIETILKLASRQNVISVINDQIGSPTFTVDLADRIVRLLGVGESGIYHITNSGYCSWYEFAGRIIEQAGLEGVRLRPITSEEFRSMARRPKYSVLDNSRLRELGIEQAPRWEDGVDRYLGARDQPDDIVVY
ncbi:dTDP-4-dehydrorhamnose reductase [Candidatus Sumerlaeota bacterium]